MARNRTRAARRIAEKTKANALAREAGLGAAEEQRRPKLNRARYKTQLELLANRGNITQAQHMAGARLAADYARSETIPARLIGRYEANMPRAPKKYQSPSDGPECIAARERFEAAMEAVGPFLRDILIHLQCVTWPQVNGRECSLRSMHSALTTTSSDG
jgi:Domain of unknown function (DUF6456)